MRAKFIAMACIVSAIVGVSLSVPAAEQVTIFTTKDFRKDSALWTNPAYYRNNTVGSDQRHGAQHRPLREERPGGRCEALSAPRARPRRRRSNLQSPYQFTSAQAAL